MKKFLVCGFVSFFGVSNECVLRAYDVLPEDDGAPKNIPAYVVSNEEDDSVVSAQSDHDEMSVNEFSDDEGDTSYEDSEDSSLISLPSDTQTEDEDDENEDYYPPSNKIVKSI